MSLKFRNLIFKLSLEFLLILKIRFKAILKNIIVYIFINIDNLFLTKITNFFFSLF